MSKDRAVVGVDGLPLPVLPPERDARVWARLVRVMFYLPGFMALLLIKTGEPASFGVTVELLMLSSAAAIVGGMFIGTQSEGAGANPASKVGTWSGSLVLELLSVVPFLCAIPALFHELAMSSLLHSHSAVEVSFGASELLPAITILPFMIYQLTGFGTLHFIVPKIANWAINAVALCMIVMSYVAYREGSFLAERRISSLLVIFMALLVLYGILRLKKMQTLYDANCPPKVKKD
jgi:hypothetical protein